jgi:hypothetical protein
VRAVRAVAPAGTSANIASHLPAMARVAPHRRAVVLPAGRDRAGRVAWTHLTFAGLDALSDAYANGLVEQGIGRGTRTVLLVKPSLDFFALVFALFKVGATLVLIDPGIGRRALLTCLDEVEPEAFVGIPAAHVARLLHPRPFRKVRALVTVGRRLGWGGVTLDDLGRAGAGRSYELADTDPAEVAAILFTSGSTGIPKGAIYTHGIFDAQVHVDTICDNLHFINNIYSIYYVDAATGKTIYYYEGSDFKIVGPNLIQWITGGKSPLPAALYKVEYLKSIKTIIQYSQEKCSKCNGMGWYVDITNKTGATMNKVTGIDRITQDFIKLLLTEKTDGSFDIYSICGKENYGNTNDEIASYIKECETSYLQRQTQMVSIITNVEDKDLLKKVIINEIEYDKELNGYFVSITLLTNGGTTTNVGLKI